MSKPERIVLNALPETVYRQTVERLTAGHTVTAVARWLMTQYRGVLQHEVFYNVRKHVAQLKFCISAEPCLLTKETISNVMPSTRDASMRALEELAATVDRVTGESVLILALREWLELLRGLHHKGKQQGKVAAALPELRRIGEALCRFGTTPMASAWEGWGGSDDGGQSLVVGNSAATPTVDGAPVPARAAPQQEQVITQLGPAEYDQALKFMNLLAEYIDVKKGIDAHEAKPDGQS